MTYANALESIEKEIDNLEAFNDKDGLTEQEEQLLAVLRFSSTAIKKQIIKELPLMKLGKIQCHRCTCGAYFIDEKFDGYCGNCGQRIKW